MAAVAYTVDMISDDTDGLAWIAACAMVKSFGAKATVTVADLVGALANPDAGLDDLGGHWQECADVIGGWSFTVAGVDDLAANGLDANGLVNLLQTQGPFVLLHRCNGFPYGAGHADDAFTDEDAHAVVVTGADSEAGLASFNNPWDDKGQSCPLQALADKIAADAGLGKTIAYWPGAVPASDAAGQSSSSDESSSSSAATEPAGSSSSDESAASSSPDASAGADPGGGSSGTVGSVNGSSSSESASTDDSASGASSSDSSGQSA